MTREQKIIKTEKLIRDMHLMGLIESDKPLTPRSIRQLAEAAVEGDALSEDFVTEGLVV